MQELDFSKVRSPIRLTPEYILSKIDQTQIMLFYLGRFKIGKAFNSPFRKDELASAGVFIHTNGTLLYKDFRTSEILNCWQVVKKKCGCDFANCLRIVAEDFGIIGRQSKIPASFYKELESLDKEISKQTVIQFSAEQWSKKNSLFFRRGEITIDELNNAGDVFYVKELYINNQQIFNPNNFHRYAYVVNCEINGKWQKRVKIYCPQDKKMKFLSSVPLNCPGNLDTLPQKDDRLFVQKSKKDWLTCMRYFSDQIWLQNESVAALPEKIIKDLQSKYKRIIVCLGSDPHAVGVCTELTKTYGLEYFNTAKSDYEKYSLEDSYDITSHFGREELENQLHNKGFL